jgi:ABC-type transporter Mla subunit MlaD
MLKKPLLGSSYIILYSAIGNSILNDGSKLDIIVSNDIDDLVLKLNPVVTKLENIVNSVDKITTYLAKDDSELMKIVKNIEKFTSLLIENKSLLTTITGNEKATNSLIDSMEKLPSLMDNINKISSNVDKEIIPEVTKFIKELSEIAKDIENKLQKLDGVVNSVGSYDKDLLQIKDGIKTGILKSNEIIEKVDNLFQNQTDKKVILP